MQSHTHEVESIKSKNPQRKLRELNLAKLCAKAALDKKCEKLLVLEVSKLTSFSDYLVICHASSERQVQAIAKNVLSELKLHGVNPYGIEGVTDGSWALVDCGSVVFHCFEEGARLYYDLESMWANARPVKIDFDETPLRVVPEPV